MKIKEFVHSVHRVANKLIIMLLILHGAEKDTLSQPNQDEQRILMQGFYWDCFDEAGAGNWWNFMSSKTGNLSSAGITEIWLPVSNKAVNDPSMGYDTYDYFDLGEFNQMSGVETFFGSRAELESLISVMHNNGMKAYADVVFNHCTGGTMENNPNTGGQTATSFVPASGRYEFHYNDFHPSTYESSDEGVFGSYPDICHANPHVMTVLKDLQTWLINTIGYDGFRYDWTNGYHPWVIRDLQNNHGAFGVTEYWMQDKNTSLQYLANIEYTSNVFDFPLFYHLRDMCNNTGGGYDMRNLWNAGIVTSQPNYAVTFLQNHDTDKETAYQIPNEQKMLGYAYILTQQGLPTVFWRDYYNYGLAKSGTPNGIDQLMWVRKNLATGSATQLYADEDLFIMQRNGSPGLLLAINDNNSVAKTATVQTKWTNTTLKPFAWYSTVSTATPQCITTDANGNATVSPGLRGFVIYAPDPNNQSPVGDCGDIPVTHQPAMNIGGTFNSWNLSTHQMTLVNEVWRATGVQIDAGDHEFKFVNTSDWSGIDWGGASGFSGTASVTTGGGPNITISITNSSTFTFTFDDQTLYYTVTDEGSSNVSVTGVSVSPTSAILSVGDTQQLSANISPSNATNQSITWSSSNTGVATVNSVGLVTGVAAGTATITVSTNDGGYTATSSITVTSTSVQTPYAGTIAIPGIIEAENYDNGGEGVAYHDNDASNNGGQYRTSEGV
ncbi:MAG: Ig-like domain-containing protein, partial [Bacteroidales bacterium]|nr:Ig-like domain-containing protein [Bacteroidales bacterium]